MKACVKQHFTPYQTTFYPIANKGHSFKNNILPHTKRAKKERACPHRARPYFYFRFFAPFRAFCWVFCPKGKGLEGKGLESPSKRLKSGFAASIPIRQVFKGFLRAVLFNHKKPIKVFFREIINRIDNTLLFQGFAAIVKKGDFFALFV